MANIRPFRAWRYNQEIIRDINLKFSPLFDVVSQDQLTQLYSIPNNSIHISVPQSAEEAVTKLRNWKEEKILLQDALPAIYVYYQQFSLFGESKTFVRKGFVSMVRTGTAGEIVEHEATLSSSVSERMLLLEQTLLNAAPTHGLYDDPDFELEKIMDQYMENPLYEHIDYQGVINKLAVIQHKGDIERFISLLATKKIYLADGHHRLASSAALQKHWIEKEKMEVPDSMVNYHLMYLTNLRSDDLRILPIHRVLKLNRAVGDPGLLFAKITPFFSITEITWSKHPVYEDVRKYKNAIGMVIGARHFLLRLREEIDPVRDIPLDIPEAVKSLDYTLLHYFIFDRVFGIAYDSQKGRDDISYLKDYGTAMKQSLEAAGKIAFIMNDLSMKQVMEVCEAGTVMPPKSTYFYPKVVCGLVFASINDHENNSAFDACFRLAEEKKTTAGTGA